MSYVGLVPSESSSGETVSRCTATATCARCSGNRRGTTPAGTSRCRPRPSPTRPASPPWPRPRGRTAACTSGARPEGPGKARQRRQRRGRPRARRPSSGRSRTSRLRKRLLRAPRLLRWRVGQPARFLCAALGPRAMLDTRNSPAEASECATQRADIRLAVVRRTRHAEGGCGARSGYSIEGAGPSQPGPAFAP